MKPSKTPRKKSTKDGTPIDELAARLVSSLAVSNEYARQLLDALHQEGVEVKVESQAQPHHPQKKLADKSASVDRFSFSVRLKAKGLLVEKVLEDIRRGTDILHGVNENVRKVFSYGFTEILSNAIDHSDSEWISVIAHQSDTMLTFIVSDAGVGIFNKLKTHFNLPGALNAIQEMLKGKRTTDGARHSGQGIFFTSKMADLFVIDSYDETLTVNNIVNDNLINDVSITGRAMLKGTRVTFSISLDSIKSPTMVFDAYSRTVDEDYSIAKTRVTVRLNQYGKDLTSRLEAKQVMLGMENFKFVELDFVGIGTIGLDFADYIFNAWHRKHPDVRVVAVNAEGLTAITIRRAGGTIDQDNLTV